MLIWARNIIFLNVLFHSVAPNYRLLSSHQIKLRSLLIEEIEMHAVSAKEKLIQHMEYGLRNEVSASFTEYEQI